MRALASSATPTGNTPAASQSGIDSAMPMLNQPRNGASGSRKNSTKKRNSAIAGEEDPGQQAGPLVQAKHAQADLQDREQHQAFERRFVQLAGMARQHARRADAAELLQDVRVQNTIAQGTSVTLPHNSPLTKLARRPKNSPIGATTAQQIGDRQQIQLVAAAEQPERDRHADQSAMERHAAFPGR